MVAPPSLAHNDERGHHHGEWDETPGPLADRRTAGGGISFRTPRPVLSGAWWVEDKMKELHPEVVVRHRSALPWHAARCMVHGAWCMQHGPSTRIVRHGTALTAATFIYVPLLS